jgi:hypothetical protein
MSYRLSQTKGGNKPGWTKNIPSWSLTTRGIHFLDWVPVGTPIIVIDETSDPFAVPNDFSDRMALVLSVRGVTWLYRRDIE